MWGKPLKNMDFSARNNGRAAMPHSAGFQNFIEQLISFMKT